MSSISLQESGVYRNFQKYPVPMPYFFRPVNTEIYEWIKELIADTRKRYLYTFQNRPRVFVAIRTREDVAVTRFINPISLSSDQIDIDEFFDSVASDISDTDLIANPKLPLIRALGKATDFVMEKARNKAPLNFDSPEHRSDLELICSIIAVLFDDPFESCIWLDARHTGERRLRAVWTI